MVAAIALKRRGFEPEIVEIEDSFKAVGVGVNLQNSPLRALHTLDLVEEIEKRGYPTHVVNMLLADGTPMMPPLSGEPLVAGKPNAIAIGRGVLASIFAEVVEAESIPTRFNLTVDSLDDAGDEVIVTFSDGSASSYDLVLGADGVNSKVRNLALGPDAPQPQYSGQAIWRAGAAREDVDEYYLLNGPISKVGLVPISDDRMYVYCVETFETEPRWDDFDDPGAAMKKALEPFGGHVPEVAKRIEGAEIRALKVLMLDDPWYRGRVLMIGDAAHATTPHISYGLGIAVEDGIVLAELAEKHNDDVDTLLAEFMKRRYDRCKLVVDNSRQLGEWEQHPPEDRSVVGALMGQSLAVLSQPI